MGDKRRRKQDKRAKRRHGRPRPSQEAAGRLERELSDPERFTQHLDRFRELAVEDEALDAFGFPAAPLLAALLGTGPGGPAPVPKDGDLADAVLPRLVDKGLAETLSHVLAEAGDALADRGAPEADRLAVLAAIALAEDYLEAEGDEAEGEAHPFWGVVFDVSFTRAVGSAALIGAVVAAAGRPARDALAARLGAAVRAAPLAADLARAGVTAAPAGELLADTLLEVLEDDELVPSFGIEVALEGLRAQRRLLDDLVGRLVREGPSRAWTADLQALAEAAYARDPLPEAAAELRADLLVAAADEVRDGGDPGAPVALLAALDAYPPAESPLLRRAWAQTLSTPALEEAEEPLAVAVWGAPEDAAALAALEAHLRQAAPARAERVARFRARLAPPAGA